MQATTTFLMFEGRAEEAMNFYLSEGRPLEVKLGWKREAGSWKKLHSGSV